MQVTVQVERARSSVARQVRKSVRSKNCQAASNTAGRCSRSQSSFGVSISGEMRPPTNFSTAWPVALMRSACAMARWSIQTMMSRSASSEAPTGNGVPPAPSTTSEQVASKPMPAMRSGASAASASVAFTTWQTARQISVLDCSAIAPAARCSVIGCWADAIILPLASNRPARALPVPTSTPIM